MCELLIDNKIVLNPRISNEKRVYAEFGALVALVYQFIEPRLLLKAGTDQHFSWVEDESWSPCILIFHYRIGTMALEKKKVSIAGVAEGKQLVGIPTDETLSAEDKVNALFKGSMSEEVYQVSFCIL